MPLDPSCFLRNGPSDPRVLSDAEVRATRGVLDVLDAVLHDDPDRAPLYQSIRAAIVAQEDETGFAVRVHGLEHARRDLKEIVDADASLDTQRRDVPARLIPGLREVGALRIEAERSSDGANTVYTGWSGWWDLATTLEVYLPPVAPHFPDGEPAHRVITVAEAFLPLLRPTLAEWRDCYHGMALGEGGTPDELLPARCRWSLDRVLEQIDTGEGDLRLIRWPDVPADDVMDDLLEAIVGRKVDSWENRAALLVALEAYVALARELEAGPEPGA